MSARIKRYRVAEGRTVIPPVGIVRAPDGGSARYAAGETFEIDLEHPEIGTHARFLRARVRAGDLIEVEARDMPSTADASSPRRKDSDK